jgi:hypothetical protein
MEMTERGLFEPDVLLTEQFSAARRRRATISSEKRLMLAVLENALDSYQKYIFAHDRAGRELFKEAAEWIACTSNEDFFSFENISETLDINPDYLRRGLAAWRERLLERHSRTLGMPAPEAPQRARVAS